MSTRFYLSHLCDILIDCGIVTPVSILDSEYHRSLFGDDLVDSSRIIHLVCSSWMSSHGKVFRLYIDYYPCDDKLIRRAHVFYCEPISDYRFRKLRKLLKKDGYIY